MRNPQDARFLKTQQLMRSGQMIGMNRPVGRVTWAKASLLDVTSDKAGLGAVRYLDKSVPEYELSGNIRSIEIQRSIGQDAATCTIVLWNVRTSSTQPEGVDSSGTLGYLTPGRGHAPTGSTLSTQHTVTVDGAPTVAGSWWTLKYGSTTTAHIAIDASANDVATAINDINIPVVVSGGSGGPWAISYTGSLAGTLVTKPVVDYSLMGGTSPDVSMTVTQEGGVFVPFTSVYSTLTTSDDVFGDVHITYPTNWNYPQNPYRDVFIPNTVLRTYQGYGSDNFDQTGYQRPLTDPSYVHPRDDSKLYDTGIWLIDKVTISTDGTMTIECRDLAKLLIEQYIYPPMIPIDRFPLIYAPAHVATGQHESIGANVAQFHSSSVDPVFGANAPVMGHRGSDAFDGQDGTFWLSGANNTGGDLEWIQATSSGDVNEIVLNTWDGDYIVFICIHENGQWQGDQMVSGKVETAQHPNINNLSAGAEGAFFYVITSGDTLWALAGRFYGDNFKWPIIARANSNIIKDPHWIYPGQRIKIPCVAGTLSPPPGIPQPQSGGANSSYPTTYTVVPGDTLWGIAGHYYNDNSKWPVIYNANTDKIRDPHWIYPGQQFYIPYIPGTPFSAPTPTGNTSTGGSGGTGGQPVEIPYVMLATVPQSGQATISLPRTYQADYIRVVFTNLSQAAGGGSYRAGMREMVARNHIPDTYIPSTIGKAGYIEDWTEPVKEMCAWAGLTWVNVPSPNVADPLFQTTTVTDENAAHLAQPVYNIPAPAVGSQVNLRAWGDFEFLGAGPVVATPGDYFMSKSFMDGIRQITDFIGGIFYIDESGGAQFRLPNVWSGGNFVDDTAAASSLGARFNDHPIEFHEDANLVEYSAVISDESLRSEVLVIGGYPSVNASGPVAGGYVLGYDTATGTTSAIDFSNVLAGQYRMMILPGDSTKLFYTEAECQRMAELTALFILFTYRQGSLTAPCHPALQIDDQVRIYERITNESYIHYVSSIDSHQDLESGEYKMTLTTHWLGSDPNTDWFINKQNLTPAVMDLPAILSRVGMQAGGDIFEQPPYGVSGVS